MFMMSFSTLLLSALLLPVASVGAARCHDFFMPVEAHTKVHPVFAPGLDLTTVQGVESLISSGIGALSEGATFVPVGGTYNISSKYCEPEKVHGAPASRSKTVQFLFHGVPYNKEFWSADMWHKPKKYSWTEYATSQGYPTLSIDNLGCGDSSHPDPLLETQQPLQVELAHNIVKAMRAGKLEKYGVPKAEKVVLVGHSLGSVMGNGLATIYPNALDALLLTGYTNTVIQAALGLLLTELVPASVHSPSRFGSLSPGYITFNSALGKRNSYYGNPGTFNPAVAAFDFAHEDVTSVGAIATATSGLQMAKSFTGDVMAITGQRDALFCSLGSRAIELPKCGLGPDSKPAKSRNFWPKANYAYYIPLGTGHAGLLHYTAPGSLKAAHAFLAKNGY